MVIENKRATGVMYWQRGDLKRADVAKARSFCQPAPSVRRRSSSSRASAPASICSDLDIKVVHELKGVGANLQDHFQARSVYRCTKPITLNDRVSAARSKKC